MRRVLTVVLVLTLAAPAGSQTAVEDADVKRGIQHVDDGDYDGAIFTLDGASRRLAEDPEKANDLAQAYLYLGIAYMAKGHEASARAQFRAAVQRVRGIQLTPDRFPPKIIEALEKAREEIRSEASTPVAATPVTPAEKKGGGANKLLLIGGVVAAGGGAALTLSGGSSEPAAPTDPRRLQTFSGSLCESEALCEHQRGYAIVVSAGGQLDATITWTNSNSSVFIEMTMYDERNQRVAVSNRTTNTTSQLSAAVTPQTSSPSSAYNLYLHHSHTGATTASSFTLEVRHP